MIRSDTNADPIPYESPARVVLSGLGSDELLGGYGRHRTAFSTGGWPAVIQEVRTANNRATYADEFRVVATRDRSYPYKKSWTRRPNHFQSWERDTPPFPFPGCGLVPCSVACAPQVGPEGGNRERRQNTASVVGQKVGPSRSQWPKKEGYAVWQSLCAYGWRAKRRRNTV